MKMRQNIWRYCRLADTQTVSLHGASLHGAGLHGVSATCDCFGIEGGAGTHTLECAFAAVETFLRQVAGGTPKWRLNARLKAASDS